MIVLMIPVFLAWSLPVGRSECILHSGRCRVIRDQPRRAVTSSLAKVKAAIRIFRRANSANRVPIGISVHFAFWVKARRESPVLAVTLFLIPETTIPMPVS